MADKRVDLTGITVMGKQLTTQQLEERERRSQAMEEHRKEIDGKVVILRTRHRKATGTDEETKKVSKRARHFTSGEIRREYGIMAKPYETRIENMLWIIINKGPIDMGGIAEEMKLEGGKTRATRILSGPLSNINTCLGEKEPFNVGWITREMEGGRYFYQSTGNQSVEVMYKKYRENNSKIVADRAKKRNQKNGEITIKNVKLDPPGKSEFKNITEPEPEGVIVDLEGLENEIKSTVRKVGKRNVGIEIRVSGQIEILFGWKKED